MTRQLAIIVEFDSEIKFCLSSNKLRLYDYPDFF